jgi:hypothetical protein
MNNVIITIVGLVIAGGALLALQHWLANINRYREEMTEEEYEESLGQGGGMIGNAMMGFDQFIRPDMQKAIEYRIDAEQGQLPGGGGQGEKLPPEDFEPDDASSQNCEPDSSSSQDCGSDDSSSQDCGQDNSSSNSDQ